MKIITAKEMDATDRRTATEFSVPLASLMENAGAAVARFCLRQYPSAERIVVLCGKGNNGGDGMVAARLLAEVGRGVELLLLGKRAEVRGEAESALAKIPSEEFGVRLREILAESALEEVREDLESAELIVDAVVGTGFTPPLRGLAAQLRDLLKNVQAPVVAVDLPSGWDADSMDQDQEGAYRADSVVTFTAPKHAHVFGNLTGVPAGAVVVAEIGSPDSAVLSEIGLSWTGSAKWIAEQPRDVNSNKGRFGHVLVVGGSYGTSGAPAMASLAALRAGAGLVTAAVPQSILSDVARVAPELMLAPLQELDGALALRNITAAQGSSAGLSAMIQKKRISVVALGPGLSTGGETPEFVREFVKSCSLPMVVDADGLNAFDGQAALLNGEGRVLVLTPHPGEMARLAGMTVKQVEADRVGLARRFATKHQVTLVLKGWRTLVAHPDGSIAVNTSGNPAMAKGGSGDILTGIVAAMLAQYAVSGEESDVARAVEAAVYLHGLAADFATRAMDEHTVLATDTVGHLSDAFRYRVKDEAKMTWICGVHG